MTDLNRVLNVQIRAQYTNMDLASQTIQNYMGQTIEIDNVLTILETDLIMTPGQSYTATDQNFLFMVADNEAKITIDASKEFVLTNFCLIQKAYIFSFEIVPASVSCQSNIHVCHGKILIG